MQECLIEERLNGSVPVVPVVESELEQWLGEQDTHIRRWITGTEFRAKPGSVCLVPDANAKLVRVILGVGTENDPWACAGLPGQLPEGCYHVEANRSPEQMERIAIGWGLGSYRFARYKEAARVGAKLAMDPRCDTNSVVEQVRAITLVRDLINTPAQDMMPEQLAEAAAALAREFNADFSEIVGEQLLAANFPVIHTVGRASDHPPRLIDLRWGDEAHPKMTLVGKGVCFDSGGLDLKSATGMRLMKKDMGGAAHALGLARLVMSARLPLRLRLLVPAVENAVSGNAFHPGDVVRSRKGPTIEIDNTDAEGRLILCDALTEACNESPALVLDFATLTGAARVALGTEVPALFCNDETLAEELRESADDVQDPIWRLPLHADYRELLESKIADIANASGQPYGGAITAALFLQEFVPSDTPWAHFDLMAWNTRTRPGRPEGGEAMALRAVFRYLRQRFVS